MKSRSKKSMVNLSTAIFYKIVVIAVGLILPKLFITNYGSELNGLQSSVKQFFTYITLLEAGVGTATMQSLYKPVAADDHSVTNAYLSAAAYYYNKIGFVYFAVLSALSVGYALAVPVDGLTAWVVIAYVLVSGAITGLNFFYVAKIKLLIGAIGDQYLVTSITLGTFLVSSFAKIVLIQQRINIVLVEAVFLLVNVLATFVYYLIAKKRYPWISFRDKPDFSCVSQKNSVMVHRIASVVFQNVDVVLLTFFCDLKTVSIYSMYKLIVTMVTGMVGELGASIQFVLGQQFNSEADEQKPVYRRLIDTFHVFYSAIAFGLFTVTYVLLLPFLRLYTHGMDINYIFPILPMFYITMEYLMVGREAMMRTIEVAGHFKKTQNRVLTETIINLLASVILISILSHFFGGIGGICGALGGTIVALLYRTVDINLYANHRILHRSAVKTNSVMLINALLFGVVVVVFRHLSLEINSYWHFVLHGFWITVVVLVLFVGIQSLLNKRECRYVLDYVMVRRKN